jgi:hypothetical protein
LRRKDFDYEIRTTLYPPFIDEKALRNIGGIIKEGEKWVLQQFRHTKNMLCLDAREVKPYAEKQLKHMLKIAKEFTSNTELRYV